MRAVLLLLALSAMRIAQADACFGESGARALPLLELYTAKACADCRRAERWLSDLKARAPAVLAVLLHVEVREYVDGRPAHRRRFTPLQRLALGHVPRVHLQGREVRGWDSPTFDVALAEIAGVPARARIRLEIISRGAEAIDAEALAEDRRSNGGNGALYLAAYAKRPGGHLVVYEWLGPFPVVAGAPLRRMLPLPPGTAPGNSGVLGFVQDRRTAEVLQAMRLPVC